MVVPKINSAHGSDTRNIINRAIDLINLHGKTIQDLVAEGQLTPTQYATLIQTVNSLASKDEVFLRRSGININDFDEETRQTFLEAQGIDVNYVLGEGAVKNENLQFGVDPLKIKYIQEVISSSNVLDIDRVERNGYYNMSGNWISSSSYASSQFIPVSEGEVYYKNGSSHVTYWDVNRNFVEGVNAGSPFTVPQNSEIRFMKVGMGLNNFPLENWVVSTFPTLQKNKFESKFVLDGSKIELGDEFLPKVVKKELGTLDAKDLKSILDRLQVERINLIDPNDIETGGYYSADSGTFVNSSNSTTGFIKVSPGEAMGKSGASTVTYYDEQGRFIQGEAGVPVYFTVPDDNKISYMRTSMSTDFSNWMVVRGSVVPNVFVPYDDYKIPALERVGSTQTVSPNSSNVLDLSVDGHSQNTHPGLIYFENGWNGYKFWMAVTPYPYGSAFLENPCIICSNDLKEWVEPSETVNPLDAVPEAERNEWFNSDTELVFVDGLLEIWWRRRNNSPFSEEFYRRKSSDGINWTEKELCFKRETSSSELSPSIIYENGKYKMWTMQAEGTMRYYESTTGTDFVFIREIEVGNVDMWHGSVRRNKDGLYEVYYSHGVRHRNYKISYAYSTDNITYSDPVEVMKSVPLRFDSELYRPSFIDVEGGRNDVRVMAYGTVSEDNEFNIAITRALTVEPTNFQGMN